MSHGTSVPLPSARSKTTRFLSPTSNHEVGNSIPVVSFPLETQSTLTSINSLTGLVDSNSQVLDGLFIE